MTRATLIVALALGLGGCGEAPAPAPPPKPKAPAAKAKAKPQRQRPAPKLPPYEGGAVEFCAGAGLPLGSRDFLECVDRIRAGR